MRTGLIAAAVLLLGGCGMADDRCRTVANPRECARVIAAGGRFEDYRRYGLGGYQLSGGRFYRPGAMTVGRVASYDSAIARIEAREIRRRNERFPRKVRANVRRGKAAATRRHV